MNKMVQKHLYVCSGILIFGKISTHVITVMYGFFRNEVFIYLYCENC